MDMTTSVFDSHFDRMSATRAQRMMDGAQSALYAQVTQQGKSKIWNSWANIISRITHMMNMQDASNKGRSTITINGEETSIPNLIKWFRSMFGKRSVEGTK